MIAGGQNKMAPKTDMLYVKDHVSSTDVTYLEFSKGVGSRADYGHLDLNLGVHAREEAYPKIYEWLVKRSEKSSGYISGLRLHVLGWFFLFIDSFLNRLKVIFGVLKRYFSLYKKKGGGVKVLFKRTDIQGIEPG